MIILMMSRLDEEGRIAIVTTRGVGCGGRKASSDVRCDADGKGVWSWRPWAGVKPRDAAISALTGPTRRDLQATVTKRSWTPGRARNKSKTIAQGMSMFGLYLW